MPATLAPLLPEPANWALERIRDLFVLKRGSTRQEKRAPPAPAGDSKPIVDAFFQWRERQRDLVLDSQIISILKEASMYRIVRRASIERTTRPFTALVIVLGLLAAVPQARGQTDPVAGVTDNAAPREVPDEEAEAGVQAREAALWQNYEASEQNPGEAVLPREEPAVADLPAHLGIPPQPDDPGGEMILEREKQEVAQ